MIPAVAAALLVGCASSPQTAPETTASATTTVLATTTLAPTEGSDSCPATGHGAVVDRADQRAWLCTDGVAAPKFPVSTAISQPDPGTYQVYARDRVTTSVFGGHLSYLDNFVAFSYGKNTGARIAFHAIPRDADGNPFQPYDTLGSKAWFGDSSGCIRVMPEQSETIWDHLTDGDPVVVIS